MTGSIDKNSKYYIFNNQHHDKINLFISSCEKKLKIDDLNGIWFLSFDLLTLDSVDQYAQCLEKLDMFIKNIPEEIVKEYFNTREVNIKEICISLYKELIAAPDMSNEARAEFIDKVMKEGKRVFFKKIRPFFDKVFTDSETRQDYHEQLNLLELSDLLDRGEADDSDTSAFDSEEKVDPPLEEKNEPLTAISCSYWDLETNSTLPVEDANSTEKDTPSRTSLPKKKREEVPVLDSNNKRLQRTTSFRLFAPESESISSEEEYKVPMKQLLKTKYSLSRTVTHRSIILDKYSNEPRDINDNNQAANASYMSSLGSSQ